MPLGVDDGDLAVDPVAGVGLRLDPADHRGDGVVVRGEDLRADVVVADGPLDRHRFRRRAGHVEAAHCLLLVGQTEQVPAGRVQSGHHRDERLRIHRTLQSQEFGAVAVPHAGRLTAGVDVVRRELLDVVGARVQAPQRRHPGGHAALPHARVHPSVALLIDRELRQSRAVSDGRIWRSLTGYSARCLSLVARVPGLVVGGCGRLALKGQRAGELSTVDGAVACRFVSGSTPECGDHKKFLKTLSRNTLSDRAYLGM